MVIALQTVRSGLAAVCCLPLERLAIWTCNVLGEEGRPIPAWRLFAALPLALILFAGIGVVLVLDRRVLN